jgi:hypothetical protein
MYDIRKFRDEDGELLCVHPCRNQRVEIWTPNGKHAVFTRESFAQLVEWIEAQMRENDAAEGHGAPASRYSLPPIMIPDIPAPERIESPLENDLLSVLSNLGYDRAQARMALHAVRGKASDLDGLVREALRVLGEGLFEKRPAVTH